MTNEKDKAPKRIWVWINEPYQWHETKTDDSDVEYIRADLLTATAKEARAAALSESAESIVNEAGKVGQLMDLAAASARKEERAAIKSTLEDYFRHFPCTCVGQPRTGGHFAVCPITIRDEVLGRLAGIEAVAAHSEE